jgi:hypothetical protein
MRDHATATVESNGCRLTILAPSVESSEGWCDFEVEIESPGLRARLFVPDLSGTSILHFFEQMERDWHGWNESREYWSTERNLHLSAKIDRLGHIACEVTLATRGGREDWTTTCSVMIEAGAQLSQFVRDLSGIFHA